MIFVFAFMSDVPLLSGVCTMCTNGSDSALSSIAGKCLPLHVSELAELLRRKSSAQSEEEMFGANTCRTRHGSQQILPSLPSSA